jgi:lipopolysaccharide export system permease protein
LAGVATLRRYLAREIYKTTAFCFIAFLGLFAFFDLVNELSDLGKGGYRLQHAIVFVLLSVPGHIYELFPIAVLIGTLVALSSLAASSEFTVMRVSGLSPTQSGATLARIGIAFLVLTVLVGELLAPGAERAAQRLRLDRLGAAVGSELRSGVWVKTDRRFVNIREVLPDTTVRGVEIFEFDEDFRLISIAEAKSGRYVAHEVWELADVLETSFTPKGATVRQLPKLEWHSVLTPGMLAVLLVVPEKMSAYSLALYVRHLSDNRQRTERYEIALWKKLIYPFASLVMMALALPFGYLQVRAGGMGVKVFVGIMLGVVFHFLNSLFSTLGVLQSWAPFASAVLPSALFMMMAVAMMWWVERR